MSAEKLALICPFEGRGLPGSVEVSDFAGQHKDAKIALQELAYLILKKQEEHLTEWHSAEGMSSYESSKTDEEFANTERTLLPALKKELAEVDSHKDKGGYSALPPFVIDRLERNGKEHGKELKLSLSNQMVISVKNGTSFNVVVYVLD